MKKGVFIFILGVIIVLAGMIFLNLFYQARLFRLISENYSAKLKEVNRLFSKTTVLNRNFHADNKKLTRQNKQLKEDISRFKINSYPLGPLKEKIKDIMFMVDGIDLAPRKRKELKPFLHQIYTELNSLEIETEKMIKDGFLYRDKFANKKAELEAKIQKAGKLKKTVKYFSKELETWKDMAEAYKIENEKYRSAKEMEKLNSQGQQQKMGADVSQNKELMIKISEYKKEIKESLAKINYLEKEKNKYFLMKKDKDRKIKKYSEQLIGLRKNNKELLARLKQSKQTMKDLTGQLSALEREKGQYVSKKERLETKILEHRNKTNSLSSEIQALKENISIITREKNKFAASSNVLKKANDLAVTEKDRLGKKIIELKEALRDQDGKLKSSKIKIANSEKNYREVTAQYELVKREREKIEGKIVELTEAMVLSKEKLSGKEKELVSSRERIYKLEKDYQAVVTQYELIKEKVKNLESGMVKRASRILILQETLEEKDASILELAAKLQMQIKELALLRDSTVKIKLENVMLMDNLKNKGEELNSFKEKILKMKEVNSRFKAYIGTMSNLFDSEQEIETGSEIGEKPLFPAEDKKVMVEIESVEESGE